MKNPIVKAGSVHVNEIEMNYEIHGAGEPLLLLHGGGGVGANWQLIFTEPPAGYQLVVPDLRGHGRSTRGSGQPSIKRREVIPVRNEKSMFDALTS